MNFDELTLEIERAKTGHPCIIVALSGFAGAGKTSLANRLRDFFQIKDSQIIKLDNLYSPAPRGEGLFDDYDWPLLSRILADVHAGKRLQYQGQGFNGEKYLFDEPLPDFLIVEGIQLFREEFMRNFDVSVWIDCPLELAMERARARDLAQGHDATYMKRWDMEWEPRNKTYRDQYHPEQLAAFLYNQYE